MNLIESVIEKVDLDRTGIFDEFIAHRVWIVFVD
jgi:hypothetical protein